MDDNFISAIIGALIGGGITFLAAYFSTKQAHKNQQSIEYIKDKKIISGLLQAIHDEAEIVFDRYQETMGTQLESLEEDKGLLYYYPLISDFFTIYNGNSLLIGRIPDNDLRKQIIKTYTLSKAMVDSYRMNNDLVSKFEHSDDLYEQTHLEVYQKQKLAHYSSLVEYAQLLKGGHIEFKNEFSDLLRTLKEYLKMNS